MANRKIIEGLFPDHLRANEQYRVLIKVMSEEMGLISDYIDLFNNLIDPDMTPEQYLSELGDIVGYDYIDEVDPEAQREIIQRVFNIHSSRGDNDSLTKAATYGDNPGYLGGDVFVPGTYFPNQEAILVFPREQLFTWNRSKYSGGDRRPDNDTFQEGILEVVVGNVSDRIKQKTESVKPAGLRLRFKIVVVIANENVVLKIPKPTLFESYLLEILYLVGTHNPYKLNTWSGRGPIVRSGSISNPSRINLYIEPKLKISNTEYFLQRIAESLRFMSTRVDERAKGDYKRNSYKALKSKTYNELKRYTYKEIKALKPKIGHWYYDMGSEIQVDVHYMSTMTHEALSSFTHEEIANYKHDDMVIPG